MDQPSLLFLRPAHSGCVGTISHSDSETDLSFYVLRVLLDGWDIISENATAASVRWKYADDIERATNRVAVERNAANNHDFTPFISDCFGGLHSTAREHLAWQSTVCSRTGFWEGKQPQLYRAYCKRLSVATADALATIVEQRVSTLLRPAGDRGVDDDNFAIAHFGFLTAEQARTNTLHERATAAWPHPDEII